MKIVSSGRGLNSPGFYEKKKRQERIKLVVIVILSLALVSGLIYLSRQERFLVSEIIVLESSTVDKDKIVGMVENRLAGNYLGLVPRANALFYPKAAIKADLFKAFPRFKSIDLNLEKFQTLLVTIEERKPFALYCASLPTAEISECYFLDEEGFIFASAPSFSSGVYFIYTSEETITDPVGKDFVSSSEFKLLPKFIESLAPLHINATSLEVGNNDYTLTLQNGGEMIWRKDADLGLIYSNLEAFLSSPSIQAETDFLDKILLLDLRTDNKVFYKFK